MNTVTSAIFGFAFGVLGTATVFLMFHLWGYPFDKATRTSAAPKSLMRLHRVLGYAFVALYVFMMLHMVPRLFRYQVEFPARTVAHVMLGITIGFLLLVKISILRFFRHLEEWMPFLGSGILLCTYLLLGLSVPFAFRERALRREALGGDVLSAASLERLRRILPAADLPAEAPVADLATPANIMAGRDVLLGECVQCHDLRTVLVRPRAPKDWVQTVERMADKPVFGTSITPAQQWAVATYLIAISPDLQEAAKKVRAQKARVVEAKLSAATVTEAPDDDVTPFDAKAFKPVFETKCSGCHELDEVERHKWTTVADEKELLRRMVDSGLDADPNELALLDRYLVEVYLKHPRNDSAEATASAQPAARLPPSAAGPPDGGTSIRRATGSAPTALSRTATSAAPVPAGSASVARSTASPSDATTTSRSETSTCGIKPLPDCPLQAFMKQRVVPPSAAEDLGALATVLERVAKMAPPGYGSWSQIANDGASAARAGNLEAARASCSGCHGPYRAKYKSERRDAAIP
jgi:mono/diheme cytochrome c family protein